MPSIAQKIKEIEDEMARTQKNKATNSHLGLLKGKIARLRTQMMTEMSSSGPKGEGFEVPRSGNARVVLIGFPSVGKSSFLNAITDRKNVSQVEAYEFTTLTCIPGMMKYRDCQIQILDLPGIIEGAAQGKGRGKEVIAVARSADVVLMFMDALKYEMHQKLLTKELRDCGIRLNEKAANISYIKKATGGVKFTTTVDQPIVTENLAISILHDYRIHNAQIVVREVITVDQFIDAIEGNRKFVPCLYCFNKIDNTTMEKVDELARRPHSIVLSATARWNFDYFKEKLWDYLNITRVYTKSKGSPPDLADPIILRKGKTIKDVCDYIHRDFAQKFRGAKVWGKSAKHTPQQVGLAHECCDEDVVEIMVNEKVVIVQKTNKPKKKVPLTCGKLKVKELKGIYSKNIF